MKQQGTIVQAAWMRHGKTIKTAQDEDRTLTVQGLDEVREAGHALEMEGFFPDVVIASRAKRAIETARGAFGEHIQIHEFDELYLGKDRELAMIIEDTFRKLGNAPLAAYMDSPAKVAIARYATAGAHAISALLFEGGAPKWERVAIIGHAVLLPAIAYAMTREHDPERAGQLRSLVLDEAQTFMTNVSIDWNSTI